MYRTKFIISPPQMALCAFLTIRGITINLPKTQTKNVELSSSLSILPLLLITTQSVNPILLRGFYLPNISQISLLSCYFHSRVSVKNCLCLMFLLPRPTFVPRPASSFKLTSLSNQQFPKSQIHGYFISMFSGLMLLIPPSQKLSSPTFPSPISFHLSAGSLPLLPSPGPLFPLPQRPVLYLRPPVPRGRVWHRC